MFGLTLFQFQSKFVYYPDYAERIVTETPESIGLLCEDVSLETVNGEEIAGLFVTGDNSRGVVLFCHRNAGDISHRLESLHILVKFGLDVLIFDYRGYGNSEGKPDESNTYNT